MCVCEWVCLWLWVRERARATRMLFIGTHGVTIERKSACVGWLERLGNRPPLNLTLNPTDSLADLNPRP
jgi:hypothetical protein